MKTYEIFYFLGDEYSCLCGYYMTSHRHEHYKARKKKEQRNTAAAQEHGHRFGVNICAVKFQTDRVTG